jgi:hypothetical protein
MSGVFSMASHWVLQYLPDVVRQEQTGCAHFSAISGAILFSSCGWTASRLSHHGAGASGGNKLVLYAVVENRLRRRPKIQMAASPNSRSENAAGSGTRTVGAPF